MNDVSAERENKTVKAELQIYITKTELEICETELTEKMVKSADKFSAIDYFDMMDEAVFFV